MVAKKYDIKDLNGKTFNRITITGEIKLPGKDRQFTYECVCGGTGAATPFHIVSNVVKSCGCLHRETSAENGKNKATHGMHESRPYRIYQGMKTRCDNPDVREYPDYGGRGISYTNKWETFEGFWSDMQHGYSDNLTIDRVDKDGSYCKENCRWTTMKIQSHNRRKRKSCVCNSVGVDFKNNRFRSRIVGLDKVRIELGTFRDEISAAIAYDDMYECLYGDRPNNTRKINDSNRPNN